MYQFEYEGHRYAGKTFTLVCQYSIESFIQQKVAEEYFSANNFLSKKILEDISYVRDSYEDAWEVMEQEERDQVQLKISEFIVNEVFNLTKLSLFGDFCWGCPLLQCLPYLQILYGQ